MTTILRSLMSNSSRRGGLSWVRRVFTSIVFAVVLGPSAASVEAADNDFIVRVVEHDGLYTVSAEFLVVSPRSVVMSVLTDYEGIPQFMPGIRTSNVLERTPGRVVLEQEAVAKAMLWSRKIHLVLEVQETPDQIAFRNLCPQHFARYEGSWRVSEDERGTHVKYSLVADPTSSIPEFFIKRLLSRDVKDTVSRLQAEMQTRTRRAAR